MQDSKPHIVILATGGTIAGLSQNPNEYRAGVLHIDRILDFVCSLDASYPALNAKISTRQIANIDSADMSDEVWLALAKEIHTLFSQGLEIKSAKGTTKCEVNGIVITHGTDTLEESAYFLHLLSESSSKQAHSLSAPSAPKSSKKSNAQKIPKPIILTGAMRPFDALDFDGGANLYNAIALACDKNAQGVMVAMNEKIFCPRSVSKLHTTDIDAFGVDFDSGLQARFGADFGNHFGELGTIHKGRARFFVIDFASTKIYDKIYDKHHDKIHATSPKSQKICPQSQIPKSTPFKISDLSAQKALPKVDILYSYSNDRSAVAAKAFFRHGTQGLVIAGSGAGSIHKSHKKALKKLIKKGLIIVVSSRINRGKIALKKADKKCGFIDSNGLNPQKARVLLALALTQTKNICKIQRYFDKF